VPIIPISIQRSSRTRVSTTTGRKCAPFDRPVHHGGAIERAATSNPAPGVTASPALQRIAPHI
jgi:hypothetical protein